MLTPILVHKSHPGDGLPSDFLVTHHANGLDGPFDIHGGDERHRSPLARLYIDDRNALTFTALFGKVERGLPFTLYVRGFGAFLMVYEAAAKVFLDLFQFFSGKFLGFGFDFGIGKENFLQRLLFGQQGKGKSKPFAG